MSYFIPIENLFLTFNNITAITAYRETYGGLKSILYLIPIHYQLIFFYNSFQGSSL